MKGLLLLVGLLASLICTSVSQNTVDNTNWIPFDCTRPTGGAPCSGNGFCNPSTGVCNCNANFVGTRDCSLSIGTVGGVTSGFVAACTTTACQNGGQCYRPNTALSAGEVCYCTAEYTGNTCGIHRGTVNCRTGDMVVNVYPQTFTTFTGLLAVQTPGTTTVSADPDCVAQTGTVDWNGERFSKIFSTAATGNPCSASLESTADADGTIQNCYYLSLQYNSFFATISDEVFKFCCDEIANTNGGVVNVGDQQGNSGSSVIVGGLIQIIASDLIHTDTQIAVGAAEILNLGDPVSLVLSFADASVRYDDMRVVTCTASATGGPITIISGGCPNPGFLAIIRDIRKVGQDIHVDIAAYRPSVGSTITLTCDIQVCIGSCAAPASCPSTTIQSVGRKRRAASNETAKTEMVKSTQTFRVYVEPLPQTSCPDQPCGWMTQVFLPVAVVFGVLLVVVLVVSALLCFRYHNRRNTKETA